MKVIPWLVDIYKVELRLGGELKDFGLSKIQSLFDYTNAVITNL